MRGENGEPRDKIVDAVAERTGSAVVTHYAIAAVGIAEDGRETLHLVTAHDQGLWLTHSLLHYQAEATRPRPLYGRGR